MSRGWAVVSVEQMRALESAAASAGTPEHVLQANAAAQIAELVEGIAPGGSSVVVLVGPGNNGRDAFLSGRLLAQKHRRLFYYLGPKHAMRPDELAELDGSGERAFQHSDSSSLSLLAAELQRAAVAVDGLLGIGLRGPMREPLSQIAQVLNRRSGPRCRVVSVDVPSGIDADTGDVAGEAVRAEITISLGAAKAGTLRFPAADLVGKLELRPIGLPEGADESCSVRLLSRELAAGLMPLRPMSAHKSSLGWVLVVGGSGEYVGAPILSAISAARSGCGLVALGVPANAQVAAAAALPEATYILRDPRQSPTVSAERILTRSGDFKALVLGPGLGRESETEMLTHEVLESLREQDDRPAVIIDADALYLLSVWPEWWKKVPPGCVLTPHYGEMARLTGLSTDDLARRSWEVAQEHAVKWGQIIVLKGPHTAVADPRGRAWVHPHPNPALATAGSGDVLAGLIGGLAAQGCSPIDAARLGVVAHGMAAKRLLDSRGWRSLIASDLLEMLPAVLADLDGLNAEQAGNSE